MATAIQTFLILIDKYAIRACTSFDMYICTFWAHFIRKQQITKHYKKIIYYQYNKKQKAKKTNKTKNNKKTFDCINMNDKYNLKKHMR